MLWGLGQQKKTLQITVYNKGMKRVLISMANHPMNRAAGIRIKVASYDKKSITYDITSNTWNGNTYGFVREFWDEIKFNKAHKKPNYRYDP